MICPCGYDKECLPLHCGNGHNTGQCPPWPKDFKGITGTKSITVNTFGGDTELDKLLRLQQAIQVEVNDLEATDD
jgi:hypothetical protein